ncbi:hypothetical protein GCM10023161_18880 [Mycobacterium paraffinicum]|uniref:LSDAT prokaryote domain-containing protein n=1 Tax=Mycobacterium paraffinicum TaxID=53378 RepID=A0ABP8RI92_9MYCO
MAAGTVQLPRGALQDGRTVLESNHTHFVIVPGEKWGAEAPWIARTATCLAGTAPSITLLANGGKITYSDLQRSVEAGRPVIVIAGSGRTADVLVRALVGAPAEERATALVESGLIQAVSMDDLSLLSEFLVAALSGSAAE